MFLPFLQYTSLQEAFAPFHNWSVVDMIMTPACITHRIPSLVIINISSFYRVNEQNACRGGNVCHVSCLKLLNRYSLNLAGIDTKICWANLIWFVSVQYNSYFTWNSVLTLLKVYKRFECGVVGLKFVPNFMKIHQLVHTHTYTTRQNTRCSEGLKIVHEVLLIHVFSMVTERTNFREISSLSPA